MTITSTRRIGAWLAPPVVLVAVLLGVAALVALVAPSRVTDGVYQVHVDGILITTESLSCHRAGESATCVVPVGGRDLEMTVVWPDPGSCTASHGGREVPCMAVLGDYGHASPTVLIDDGLGLSEADRAGWQDAVPWWRTSDGPLIAGAVLVGLLVAASAVATRLLGGGAGLGRWRVAAVGTGLLGLAQLGAIGVVTAAVSPWTLVLAPPSLVAATAVGVWQWSAAGPNGGRWGRVVLAASATAVYAAVAVFVLLLQSGFID
ncbi:hypothetical protein [Umezawaea sp. NPDC059074]|uniref:hypothetical protein n=1 Tax=Umezawaea sp. NPDC059074 TaxID=3346716 RepID=UPI0036C9E9B3